MSQQLSDERKPAWAIYAVFFLEAVAFGQWIPRIPDIKADLALSDSQLGLALLSLPLGTLVSFAIAGRMIDKFGLRKSCQIFLPLWAVLFITPALAQSFAQLLLFLVACGLSVGLIETAMNTEAARLENAMGRRLMSRCHGFWSLGTMVGALTGGFMAQADIGVNAHFLLVMPLIALAGLLAASALPAIHLVSHRESQKLQHSGWLHWPQKSVLLLCLMPLGVNLVEGAFVDWSAVFMKDILSASPLIIAISYSSFAIVMAAVRLWGDALASRFGDKFIVQASGLAASLGIAMFSLAPSVPWAFFGAGIAGAGVAIVFPLAVTAAANRPGRSAADNVAALNMVSFTAFLIAPPMIGFMSDIAGLRVALFLLVPFALGTLLLAGQVSQTSIK
ncbi:MAG: MFS transporter [Granulosicoccus sp.]